MDADRLQSFRAAVKTIPLSLIHVLMSASIQYWLQSHYLVISEALGSSVEVYILVCACVCVCVCVKKESQCGGEEPA